jgi:hypothetical protein
VITSEELAAIAAALALLSRPEESAASVPASRWKLAAREPDLEIEDLRVH